MYTENQIKNPWLIFMVVTIGTFMVNIDSTMINVALPTLEEKLQVSLDQLQWVIIIYLLIITSILPFIGKLSDEKGRKKFFITGVAIFIVASSGSALSQNLYMLITTRAIQAFGGAMIMGNVMGIVANIFPLGKRGRPLGMIGAVVALGTIVGPSIGGLLIEHFSWRAIFLINVPLGILSIVGSLLLLPSLLPKGKTDSGYDIRGALLFFLAMSTLLLQLTNSEMIGWTSPAAIGIISISLLSWILFIFTENRVKNPMIELDFFKNKYFTINSMGNFFFYYLMMSTYILLPLFHHHVLDLSADKIGILMTPQAIVMVIFAPISGWLSDRIGTLIPSVLGMSVIAGSVFLMSQFSPTTPIANIVFTMALIGFGFALFGSPNNVSIIESLPPENSGIAGSLIATMRNFGQVSGTTVGILLLNIGLDRFNGSYAQATSFVFMTSTVIALVALSMLSSQFFFRRNRKTDIKQD